MTNIIFTFRQRTGNAQSGILTEEEVGYKGINKLFEKALAC